MTDEERKLVLKDLSARLPYDPYIKIGNNPHPFRCSERFMWILNYGSKGTLEEIFLLGDKPCKPYLRPMSSMTEEEKKEYGKVCELDTEILANHPMNGEPFPALYNSQDWLNANHFDYRGLIEKGLAIEVNKSNNPYEKESWG